MKQVKFLVSGAIALSTLFLYSCGSGDGTKAAGNAADSPAVKKDSVAVVVPAPSGPVMVMTITHKIADYAKWKPAYDGHDSFRLAHGLHNYVIARGLEDSNMIMVAMRMDDVAKAKEMAGSKDIKDRMKKGGVRGPVSIDYVESILNDTTAIQQTARLMVKHKVKDWDTFKKAFDGHKQARMDAGLTDRVIGYTVGDNHSVTLVFAVADIAKAKAFISSKDLKDKMAEAGVDGPPTFFFYRIAEKY